MVQHQGISEVSLTGLGVQGTNASLTWLGSTFSWRERSTAVTRPPSGMQTITSATTTERDWVGDAPPALVTNFETHAFRQLKGQGAEGWRNDILWYIAIFENRLSIVAGLLLTFHDLSCSSSL